jgi:hypothetical protein
MTEKGLNMVCESSVQYVDMLNIKKFCVVYAFTITSGHIQKMEHLPECSLDTYLGNYL